MAANLLLNQRNQIKASKKPNHRRSLRISEIFLSLQGESKLVGLPTVFIRLTGCPLRCVYCDTEYAFKGGTSFSIDEILEQVKNFNVSHVTVTGGEPLAQKQCIDLLSKLCDKGFIVSLETSGAFDLKDVDKRVIKVMDLKTPSSGESKRNLFSNLNYLSKNDQIKFVIGNEKDYSWSLDQTKERNLSQLCEVLFSPIANKLEPAKLADWIIRDRLPVRFQLQLHKVLWGDERGK